MYYRKSVLALVKSLLCMLLFALACSKGEETGTPEPAPIPFSVQLSTTAISNVTAISAQTGGSITVTGSGSIKSKGICWNTSPAPTMAHNKTESGTGTESFTTSLSGLSSGTTYYVRSFAIDDKNNTHYGNELSFTSQYNVQVTTSPITIKSTTSAEFAGNISVTGAENLKSRGFCYGLNPLPTVANIKVEVTGTTGNFTSTVNTLTAGTTYYVRAFAVAHNDVIFYGNDVTFSTTAPPTNQQPTSNAVTVTTLQATSITNSSANVGGTASTTAMKLIGAKGICWATTTNPTISNFKTMLGGGEGSFQSTLTNLQPNTKYYARAWAWDESQTVTYGNEISFTTTGTGGTGGNTANNITISTSAISAITSNSATSGGTITVTGLESVSSRGVCWGTSSNPTINNSKTNNSSGSGAYQSSLTGLTANTKYYVRAYAINGAGTAFYGNELSFTTTSTVANKITVTTGTISNITSHSGTGGGTITIEGSETVKERGICWSSGPNPQKANSLYSTSGSGPGSFQCALFDMSPKTKIYVRAFAVNANGQEFYGNEVTFTTADAPAPNPANFSLITHPAETSLGTHPVTNQQVLNVKVTAEVTNLTRAESIKEFGIVYGFSSGQTLNSNIREPANNITEPNTKETFSIGNIPPGSVLYIRSYLITKEGNVYYGNEITAYTPNTVFSVATWVSPYDRAQNILTLTGFVQNTASERYTAIGFAYAKHGNPTLSDNSIAAGNVKQVNAPAGDEFTSALSTLAYSTTYYYRAYAKTNLGRTLYGGIQSITTSSAPSSGGGGGGGTGGNTGGGDTGGGGTTTGSRNSCLTVTNKGQINQCTSGAFSVTVTNTSCTDKIDIRIILKKKNGQTDAGLTLGVAKGASATYWTCDGTGEFQIQSRTAGSNTPFPAISSTWQR